MPAFPISSPARTQEVTPPLVAPNLDQGGWDQAPLSTWDSVKANFTSSAIDTIGARDEALRAALYGRSRQVEAATGQVVPRSAFMIDGTTDVDALGQMVDRSDPDGMRAYDEAAAGARVTGVSDADHEAAIEKLRAEHPLPMANVPTGLQLRAQVAQRLTDAKVRAAQAQQDHPAASFAGGALAAATDPLNLATGALGGAALEGSPLWAKAIAQAPIWGGLAAAEAPAKIAEAQRVGGPAYDAKDAFGDVVTAAATGPLMELGLHGLGHTIRWGVGRVAPGLFEAARAPGETGDLARGVLTQADQAGRDAMAIGPERSGGDYDAALASLRDLAPPPEIEPARNLEDLFDPRPTAPELQNVETGLIGSKGDLLSSVEYKGRQIYSGNFDPRAVDVAPDLFQYKAGGDAAGVTDRLKGVGAWDPTSSGKVILWEDPTGARFIADGHQRRGLALRMDQAGFDPKLDGYLFRAADGWTAQQVRVQAALKNIREGSGSILDAAKVFRDSPGSMNDDSLPVSGDFIRQAKGLARLNPDAFGAVINKVVPERYAAEIGLNAAERPDLHAGMIKLLKDGTPANADEARALVQESLLDDWIKGQGDQADLFGGAPPEATTIARAKIKASVLRSLRSDERIAKLLVRHADAIEAGGNTLARDANEVSAAVNDAALAILQKLSLRQGELGEAFAEAAREVIDGRPPGKAAAGVLARVKAAIASGERIEGVRLATFDPSAPSLSAMKLLDGFDEPGGKGAAGQIAPKPEEAAMEVEVPAQTFKTSKGSTYVVDPDGTTTRDKAPRPEHPGEQGVQPRSEQTVYVSAAEISRLSSFQLQGSKQSVVLRDGYAAVRFDDGKYAGKIDRESVVRTHDNPALGLAPVELWDGGKRVHFGNEIVEIGRHPGAETALPRGLFDDLEDADRASKAMDRLRPCVPGE